MNAPGAPADFLGRLAARALGQTPPLGPRPAEPFEGSAGLSEEVLEGASLPPAESPRSLLAGPMDLPPADSPRFALTDPQESPLRRDWDHAPEGAALQERTLAHTSETPALKGRTLNSLGLQPQVHALQDPLRPEGAVPFLERLPSQSVPGAVFSTRPAAEDAVPPRRPGGAEATERIAENSASLTPRAALERESLSLARGTANLPGPRVDQRVAPPAEPVIRVTIGRIEVRALAPTAPTVPAARPAAPRLGLAEYLRRRGEGRP
jgi:hypothetical protein